MSKYCKLIIAATGCNEADARRVENIMRDTFIHSMLDWHTRDQLVEAARFAVEVLNNKERGEE